MAAADEEAPLRSLKEHVAELSRLWEHELWTFVDQELSEVRTDLCEVEFDATARLAELGQELLALRGEMQEVSARPNAALKDLLPLAAGARAVPPQFQQQLASHCSHRRHGLNLWRSSVSDKPSSSNPYSRTPVRIQAFMLIPLLMHRRESLARWEEGGAACVQYVGLSFLSTVCLSWLEGNSVES